MLAAALLGCTGVMAGAFGAHGLADQVTPARLEIWRTASNYQLLHALALLCVGLAIASSSRLSANRLVMWVCRCWLVGALVFSGSLYGLVMLDLPVLGAVTPFGGTLLIIGWALLFWLGTRQLDSFLD